MTKLTPSQTTLLKQAADHASGQLPSSAKAAGQAGSTYRSAVKALAGYAYIARNTDEQPWHITAEGKQALAGEADTKSVGQKGSKDLTPAAAKVQDGPPLLSIKPAPQTEPTKSTGTKVTRKSQLLEMLCEPEGVSIAEIQEAFDWQAHSARAALTGLRKAGHQIERVQTASGSRYRLLVDSASATAAE